MSSRDAIGSKHFGFDVESNILRLVALMRVGSDADRQYEIVHKYAVGLGVVLVRIKRITACCEQSVIDFGHRRDAGIDPARLLRDQSAHDIDCMRR